LPTFDVVAPERRPTLLDQFVMMPAWPAAGSVREAADGTILVKLGDEPNVLCRQLLARKDPSAKANDEPFYRLSTAEGGSWSVRNASAQRRTSEGIALDTLDDPNLLFRTSASQIIENCSRIELHTRLKIERSTSVQFFYKMPGQTEVQVDMADTQISPATDGGFVDVNIQIFSRRGFADSFRLDPVNGRQRVTIGELELFCR
jgi:hypothetical protein